MIAKRPDKQYLSGIFYSLLANGASILGGLLTIAVASRYLNQQDLGIYYIILMIANLGIAFAGIGGRSAIIKYLSCSKDKETTANILITIRITAILIVTIGLGIALFFLERIWPGTSLDSIKWIILPMVAMEIINNSGMSMLAGFGRFKKFALLQGIRGVLAGGMAISWLLMGFGLAGILWSTLAVNLFINIAIWNLLPIRFRLVWDYSKILEILKFGGILYIAYLISILTARTAEAMIISFLGPASVAIYGNAMRFPNLLLRLFEAIRPIILQFFSSKENHTESLAPLKMASISMSFVSSLLIVFARPLTILLFSRQYLSCVPLTRLLCFWVVLSLINFFLVIQLTGRSMVSKLVWLNALQFILVIGGHLLLIPVYGVFGAALSITTAVFFTVPVSSWFLAEKNTHNTARIIMACFRPILPLFVLFIIVQTTEPLLTLSVIYWLIFAGTLFCIKAIPMDEIKYAIKSSSGLKKPQMDKT